MTEKQPDRFRLGRTIALAGVVFVISLAIISMTLLGFGLIPEILPTLFPSAEIDQQTVVDHPSNHHPNNTIKNIIGNDFENNNADH
jgi:hypothetical protein